jgi:hypothetical protein
MLRFVTPAFALFGCSVLCSVGTTHAGAQAAQNTSRTAAKPAGPTVIIYPAPAGEPLSEDFELTVGGQKVPVYPCRVSAMPFNQVWPGYQRPMDQTEIASFAYWDMTGPVDVEVVSRRPVESVAIRPTARGTRPQVDGRRITFCLASPEQITVEINGWHKALHLFASPPPAAAPNPRDPQVRYFGPTMPSAEPSSASPCGIAPLRASRCRRRGCRASTPNTAFETSPLPICA